MAPKFNATKDARMRAIRALVRQFQIDSDQLSSDVVNCWNPLLELSQTAGLTSRHVKPDMVKKSMEPYSQICKLIRHLKDDLQFVLKKNWVLVGERLRAYYSDPRLFKTYTQLAQRFSVLDSALDRVLNDPRTSVKPKIKAPNRPLRLGGSGPVFNVTPSYDGPFTETEAYDPLEDRSNPFSTTQPGSFKRIPRRKKLEVERMGDPRRIALKRNLFRRVKRVHKFPFEMIQPEINAMLEVHNSVPDQSQDKKSLRDAINTAHWLRGKFRQAMDGITNPKNDDLQQYLKTAKRISKRSPLG